MPSPSSESRWFLGINLLGEGGSFAGGGGRPRLQTSFPSPASDGKFYTETRRWGGESKGWGLQCSAVYERIVIFLNIKLFIFYILDIFNTLKYDLGSALFNCVRLMKAVFMLPA